MIAPDRRIVVSPQGPIVRVAPLSATTTVAFARLTADGRVDASFGADGAVLTGIPGLPEDLVRLPDGRLVAGGGGFSDGQTSAAAWRFLSDGRRDPSFGQNGVAETRVVDEPGLRLDFRLGRAMAVRPDGRVLVGGASFDPVADPFLTALRATVVQYDAAGARDPSFGLRGITFVGSPVGIIAAMAVAADGTLVVAGSSASVSDRQIMIARLDRAGSPDGAFGVGGFVRTALPDGAEAADVRVLDDGSVLVAGCTRSCSGPFGEALLLRYRADGSPDPAFGAGGVVVTPVAPGLIGTLNAIAVTPEGSIVGTGHAEVVPGEFSPRVVLLRWRADGRLDEGFANGIVAGLPPDTEQLGNDIALEPDGQIVVGGGIWNAPTFERDALVLRFDGCGGGTAGVRCRLASLAAAIDATPELASIRASLQHVVAERALGFVDAIDGAAGDTRKRGRAVRKLDRTLATAARRLGRRIASGDGVVQALVGDVATLRALVATLG